MLSNTNALEVPGLQDLTRETAANLDKLRALQGKVAGFGDDTVDALRALEAFKPAQGWSLFRRPASLVRRDTLELAQLLDDAQGSKQVARRLLFGERVSGKSVLALQAMALAYRRGWIVVHFPEAQDLVIAHTSYRPEQTSDGKTIYIQPHYTAQLLGNIVKANQRLLSNLRLSKQHQLPVPVQPNMSLDRFAELGANDPDLAWPVWQAFWSELTTPSQSDRQGMQRPPVFVGLDGVDHVMRTSAYLDFEANPIHAHDLALVRDYMALLSGKTSLPNGGMVIAAATQNNSPSTPTLDHCCDYNAAMPFIEPLTRLRDRVLEQARAGRVSVELLDMDRLLPDESTHRVARLHFEFRQKVIDHCNSNDPPEVFVRLCDRLSRDMRSVTPRWDPYAARDERVADVMETVPVQEIKGLSKEEARGLMEYYAQSGMLRTTVTDGLVSEKWTLAGSGIIGEIQKGSIGVRF